MESADIKICKYCANKLEDCLDEGLTCTKCSDNVHLRCLKTGVIPGALYGDVFYVFTCTECSSTNTETFIRDKIAWSTVIVLVLYHLQTKSPGLGRKGFFHWRHHIAALIDKNWEILFHKDVKKKKKWVGTVAGTLSHFTSILFKSGTAVMNEQAWWALMYPKLTPNVISKIYTTFMNEKQKTKVLKLTVSSLELFQQVLDKYITDKDLLTTIQPIFDSPRESDQNEAFVNNSTFKRKSKQESFNKRKTLLPTLESTSKKLIKLSKKQDDQFANNDLTELKITPIDGNLEQNQIKYERNEPSTKKSDIKLLDPFCHYNTSLNDLSQEKGIQMKIRLMGGIRKELILSPYSGIYLKPYIRRDVETYPLWLKLMYEIQIVANRNNVDFDLTKRAPIDYTYVQPEHIPAINSLCNQFFWSGIDLTESLQYPDFSCVVLYKKLVVAFAFLVPNVKYTENYISFVFTRPGWRNVGIAKFMIYHLIQTSIGKDITIHVSINNPALLLYQKFGFKVESVELNFYDKYIRHDTKESKHAFFCRLER